MSRSTFDPKRPRYRGARPGDLALRMQLTISGEPPKKTLIIAILATFALAADVAAAPERYQNAACTGSSFTPHGLWDCR